MRYLILIYMNEQQFLSRTPESQSSMTSEYRTYMDEMGAAGILRAGDQLQPSFTATTIRVRDGKTLNTDGPFAETKEQLGGYFIIETDSIDDAISWGGKCPGARHGSIEVRPLVVQPMAGKAADVTATAAASR
ncbi:MAG: YciI family protein [Gemmatimonadaceae bacterium]